MNPFASIIIPVYNSEKTIRFCLDHILEINNQCFEVIVVNDGGTDDTMNILNSEYSQHLCIKTFDLPHQGVSGMRNFGIEQASGDWILFVDSDQTLSRNIFDNLDSFANEDLVLFNRATLWLKGNNSYIKSPEKLKAEFIYGHKESLSYLYDLLPSTGKQCFWCTDKLFKTSIIKNNSLKFPVNLDLGEDGIFVTSYMKFVDKMRVEPKMYNFGIVKKGLVLHHLATKKRSIDVIYRVISECYKAVNRLALSSNSEAANAYAENYLQDRLIRAFIWNSKNYDLDNNEFEKFVNTNIIPVLKAHNPSHIKGKDIRFFRDCLLSKGLNSLC